MHALIKDTIQKSVLTNIFHNNFTPCFRELHCFSIWNRPCLCDYIDAGLIPKHSPIHI